MRKLCIAIACAVAGQESTAQRALLNSEQDYNNIRTCQFPSARQVAEFNARQVLFSQDDLRIRLWAMGVIPTMKLPAGTTVGISYSNSPSKHYVVKIPLTPGDPYIKRCLTFGCRDGTLVSDANWFYPPGGMDRAEKLPSQTELDRMRGAIPSSGLSRRVQHWRDSVKRRHVIWCY